MNLLTLFHQLPPAVVVSFLAANVIPYLSALATRAPSWLTGFLTLALAAVNGFLSTWVAQGDRFDWRAAAGSALVSWVVAVLHHRFVLAGTPLQARLHAVGRPGPAAAAPVA